MNNKIVINLFFFFQAEDSIRDAQESRGLGEVYKRRLQAFITVANNGTEAITSLEISFQREDDRSNLGTASWTGNIEPRGMKKITVNPVNAFAGSNTCILYTSDAADE